MCCKVRGEIPWQSYGKAMVNSTARLIRLCFLPQSQCQSFSLHAEDAMSGTGSCSAVELHLLMEVPRLCARTLQTDTFMVFQVQTRVICDQEKDVVLSTPSLHPLLSHPKHTWLCDATFPGLVNNIAIVNYFSIFVKN